MSVHDKCDERKNVYSKNKINKIITFYNELFLVAIKTSTTR
jgi:hypothetical protein